MTPRRLGMFPLSTVLFPSALLPLHVFEPRYRALTTDCLAGDGEFGIVLIERGSEVGGGDVRVDLGTLARIESATPFADGRWGLIARGLGRIRVVEWLPDGPYPMALIEDVVPAPFPSERVQDVLGRAEVAVRRVRALLSELRDTPPLSLDESLGGDPETRAWRLCAEAPLNPLDRFRVLRTDDPIERVGLLIELTNAMAEDLSQLLGGARGAEPNG